MGDIGIKYWLLPAGWLYGAIVSLRNKLFDWGILRSRRFRVAVISVGNLAVGGTGKTPHVEHLLRLLHHDHPTAVLSRGYKRRTKGFVLASDTSTADDIGDEPMQIKTKFDDVIVAVDEDRCHGIDTIMTQPSTRHTEAVVLDDAFQHRYVHPGLSIVLIEHDRAEGDRMLPAGRLREPMRGIRRADVVVVTKCPPGMEKEDFTRITRALPTASRQPVFFSAIDYGDLVPVFHGAQRPLSSLASTYVLLVTGIANASPLLAKVKEHARHVTHISYGDHHHFSASDLRHICETFDNMPQPKVAVTTDKDAARLMGESSLADHLKNSFYQLPIRVRILQGKEDEFNHKIIDYVLQKNSRNSSVDKG